MKSLNALTYARVSTERDQNPGAQVDELKRYCEARGWRIIEEIADHGYSGGSAATRPGLKRLLGLARTRAIDIIVVTKLDRLARSLQNLVSMLDEFNSLGVRFVSVHDQIDLTTAAGRLMVHIIASFAEFERALIRERTVAGLAHARRKGHKLGRPQKRDEERILLLKSQGRSHREICLELRCSMGAVVRSVKAHRKRVSGTIRIPE